MQSSMQLSSGGCIESQTSLQAHLATWVVRIDDGRTASSLG